ncbi:hypothetical protein AL755_05690 [Arthrobacter sp. ERGS1:01]|nr:hypothetical protein AL755_05690 [Arthrobacter sp. ERGS1:01]
MAALSLAGLLTATAGFAALPAAANPLPAADATATASDTATDMATDAATATEAATDAATDTATDVATDSATETSTATDTATAEPSGTAAPDLAVQDAGGTLPSLSFPTPGALVSTTQAFNGSALPGATVRMLDTAHNPVCTTTADEFGNFQCIPGKSFALGPLTLTPSMTPTEGAAVEGDPATWTVIASPVITSPQGGEAIGDLPVFTGTGYPGAAVDIVGGHSGLSLCSAKVGADGTFSCPMTRKLLVGSLDVFPALNWGQLDSVSGMMITVDVRVTPKITSPVDGGTMPASPMIEGVAGAFSTVTILDENGKTVCTVKADVKGAFSCVAAADFSPGSHSLTPVQTSLSGVANTGTTVHVTVAGAPAAVVPTTAAAAPSASPSAPAVVEVAVAGSLANTGANGVAAAGLAAGTLLLAGAGALLMLRRRTRTH